MPRRQNQKRIIVGRGLYFGDSGLGGGNAEDTFEMGDRRPWPGRFGASQIPVLHFGHRVTGRDDPGFFQQEGVKLGQLDRRPRLFRVGSDGGGDRPG
jgi:hypothetical protein